MSVMSSVLLFDHLRLYDFVIDGVLDLHSVLQKNQAITKKKGLERMKPEELYPYIEKNQPNICQISVLQNGQEP